MTTASTPPMTSPATDRALKAALEAARQALDLETLEDRKRDALDFHEISVGSIRRVVQIAFEAGLAAAGGAYPAPAALESGDMLATLTITQRTARATGGEWVSGTIAGHAFEALVFRQHAKEPGFELADTRVSKLWLQESASKREVACFERGWTREPETEAAKAIVGLLAEGLGEHLFGE